MFRIFEITDAMICMGEILKTRAFNLCDRFANLQSQVFFPTAHVHFFIFIFGCFYFFPQTLCLHHEISPELDVQSLLLQLRSTGTGHVLFKTLVEKPFVVPVRNPPLVPVSKPGLLIRD
jgi:hypothetical protein